MAEVTVAGVIHLIDDDEAVRRSLAFSLTAAGLAVRAYASAVAFLEAVPDVQPGCIVTDIRMPDIDGLNLQRQLNNLHFDMPLIVMTGHGDVRLAVEAMKGGAADFIEKPFDDEVLLAAIRAAIEGHDVDRRRGTNARATNTKLHLLTKREREVLEGLLAGCPNKTIAYDLKISARTVEVHRANVMMKMGAGSLSDLVRMALIAEMLAPS